MGANIEAAVQMALGGFLKLAGGSRDADPSTPLGPTLEGAYALGRGEARSGRSMDALLAAYRVGARVAWREMARRRGARPGRRRDTMAQFAELVFAYIDELSAASVAGHTDELATTGRVRQRYLERLGQHLLAGAGADVLAAAAERADWAPPRTLTAVLLPAAQVRGVLAPLGAGTLRSARTCPARGRRRPAARAAARARRATGPAAGTCCGCSPAGRRWSARRGRGCGARSSYDRAARHASALPARAPTRRGTAVDTEQHLAELVRRAPTRRRSPTCGPGCSRPLAELRPATAERLAETLRSWLLHQGRRDAVAAELHVHAQTVRYRMGQLRELYGDRLEDPAHGARARAGAAPCRPSSWGRPRPDRRRRIAGLPSRRAGHHLDSAQDPPEPVGRTCGASDPKVAPRAGDVPGAAARSGRDLLAVDWEATPLGAPETWPQSLESVVRLVLTSRFSMWMAWGPELTFFCNDAYRRDTLGNKYPWALGKPASTVWSEIWDDIGPRINTVMATGGGHLGRVAACCSSSAAATPRRRTTRSPTARSSTTTASIGGCCAWSRRTPRRSSPHRRMQTLRDLGARPRPRTSPRPRRSAPPCDELGASPRTLPFTLAYLFDDGRATGPAGRSDRLRRRPPGRARADRRRRTRRRPGRPAGAGRRRRRAGGRPRERFAELPTGAWDQPPVAAAGGAARCGGARRAVRLPGRRRSTATDRSTTATADFCDLVAGQIAAGLTDARAYEFERGRAETPGRARPGQDRLLHQRQPRVPHPADAAARPGRGRARRRRGPARRPAARPGRGDPPQRPAAAQAGQHAAGLLPARVRPRRGAGSSRSTWPATPASWAACSSPAAERVGLRLTVDCPPLPEPVYVDRDLWAKIVLNLISNALKFTFDGRRSRSRCREDRRARSSCRVADTGTGIPAAELPHLFERFHRVTGAGRGPTRAPASGWRWSPSSSALHGGDVSVEQRARRGQHLHGAGPVRRATTCPPTRSPTPRRPSGRRARGGRGLPGRGAPVAWGTDAELARRPTGRQPATPSAGPGRRRQRRHPRVRRGPARRGVRRAHRRRTAPTALSHGPRPVRRTWC